jgi:hypothetical protein
MLHQGPATGSPDVENGWIIFGQPSYDNMKLIITYLYATELNPICN